MAKATPWMQSNPNAATINAVAQIDDPVSPFRCWKAVLEARKTYKDIIVYGNFDLHDENENVFAYTRESEDRQTMLVVCNFTPETVVWDCLTDVVEKVVLSNGGKSVEDFRNRGVPLSPYEAFAVLIQ